MSEEEIQKIKCIHLADYKASDKLCPAIEMLKKEKEKNLYKDNIIKNLGLKTIPKTITEFKKIMQINYISKDKIREKIKEYDGLKEMDMQAYEEQIKPLKELLEEE